MRRLLQPVTVDLRSLAVLRLALAGLLLYRLGDRLVVGFMDGYGPVSLTILGLGVPVALLLGVGYRSRLAAGLGFGVLIAATAVENPAGEIGLLPNAGEAMLALLLLCAAVLPVGLRYSLDSAVNTTRPKYERHVSVASFMLVVTFLAINLGPTLWSPPHLFAGPEAAAASASPAAAETPWALTLDAVPLTLTAAHLTTLAWLPATVDQGVNGAVLTALVLLVLPVFQTYLRGLAALVMVGLHLLLAADFPDPMPAFCFAAIWLALVPPGLWDALFARLRTPARLGLTIWYHGNDPAHLRRVRVLSTFLLIPDTLLRRSDENVDIDVYRRQRDSWVVTDHLGYRSNRFRAFAVICRASPLAFPLAPILRSSFVEAIGDWFYDFGKYHRGPLTRVSAALNFRAIPARVPLWQQVIALIVLSALVVRAGMMGG